MAARSMLAAGVAVILAVALGVALVDASARATAEPTIVVVDDPHDVAIHPGTPLTRAEQHSIELKRFEASPATDGRVRFTVKIAQVLRTPRFAQHIDIEMYAVPLDAEGWMYGQYTITTGPNPLASADLDFSLMCRRLHVRLDRAPRRCRWSCPPGASVEAQPR